MNLSDLATDTSGGTATAEAPKKSWFDTLGDQYQTILGRPMDDNGKAFWSNADANTDTPDAALESDFLKSAAEEIRNRKPAFNLSSIQAPTNWDVQPNQTVANQLESVLKTDSPLMQLAKTRALQGMNRSGTLNSSMAETAGQEAVIDKALPIAQQDAGTFADAGKTNANSANTFAQQANAFTRDQTMANFNVGANDWAADRNFGRTEASANNQLGRQNNLADANLTREEQLAKTNAELQKGQTAAVDAGTLTRGYVNALSSARTDYAEKLAGISSSSTMDAGLKAETLANLRTSYNTIISNYAKLLGWDPASWVIQADTAATPAPTPAPVSGGGNANGV